jgi:hypothetical protein
MIVNDNPCFRCIHRPKDFRDSLPVSARCFSCISHSNFEQAEPPKAKPPLGIKPRWLLLEQRNRSIIEAMHRKADDCMDKGSPMTLDPEWIMELLENNKELLAHYKP